MKKLHRKSAIIAVAILLATSSIAGWAAGSGHAGASQATVASIARDPADIPPPVGDRPAGVVRVSLVTREVVGALDPAAGTTYRYWTFNGKVPGPMIRVREGDTVELTLHNDAGSSMVHSIDLHAVIGASGGGELTQALPGETKTFTFRAGTPGLYVYHCATPAVADHIANGMYGMILVEPAGGLPHVDHEYYVMQGEVYTSAPKGTKGLQAFSEANLMNEVPQYFVFNGAVDALSKQHPMQAQTGETVRIFFGDAGPDHASALHMMGQIFTKDYTLGSLTSPPVTGVQTAIIPPGDASVLELTAATAGHFGLVDHAISRVSKGLMAMLDVSGAQNAELVHPGPSTASPPTLSGMTAEDLQETTAPDSAAGTSAALTSAAAGQMNSATMPGMGTETAALTQPKLPVTGKPAASALSGGLNGCLTLDGLMPKLTIFGSSKTYRLQPLAGLQSENPLIFADNANAMVHVGGEMLGSKDVYDADHSGIFQVRNVIQLAPSCSAHVSLPELMRAWEKKQQAAQPREASAVSTNSVRMADLGFLPPRIEVSVGERVVWHNTSNVIHNVVDNATMAANPADVFLPVSAKPFQSAYLRPGDSYSQVFTKPGTYRYICTLHEGNGMKGVIIVRPGVTLAKAGTATRAAARAGNRP